MTDRDENPIDQSAKCWWIDDGTPCDKAGSVMVRVRYPEQDNHVDDEIYCEDHAISAVIEVLMDSVIELLAVEREGVPIPEPRYTPESWNDK